MFSEWANRANTYITGILAGLCLSGSNYLGQRHYCVGDPYLKTFKLQEK